MNLISHRYDSILKMNFYLVLFFFFLSLSPSPSVGCKIYVNYLYIKEGKIFVEIIFLSSFIYDRMFVSN